MDLYSKLDDVETARNVFGKTMEKNAVSWNSIGRLTSGNLAEGWKVFGETPRKDVISWNSILSGYTKMEM